MKHSFLLLPLTLLFTMCASIPEERPSKLDYSRAGDSFSMSSTDTAESPKKLCLFLDGTANDYDSHTNIRRLYELISAPRDPRILCYYDPGVGSNELPFTGMVGGAGFSKNISQAHAFLRENYCEKRGDQIYLFGFSRGARQGQVLCDIIDECGLPPLGVESEWLQLSAMQSGSERTRFDDLPTQMHVQSRNLLINYKRYIRERRRSEHPQTDYPPIVNETEWPTPRFKFVGIFDNVESLANNVVRAVARRTLRSGVYQDHEYYEYDFPENIDEAYHAMAMDEMRGLYEVIKWVRPDSLASHQHLEQVWFAGSHGDVGGGYEETQSVSAIPLNWMLEKIERGGHELFPDGFRVYQDNSFKAPLTDSREFTLPGKFLKTFREDVVRSVYFWNTFVQNSEHPSSIKYSQMKRTRVPVHFSVVERMKADLPEEGRSELEARGQYRPRVFQYTPDGVQSFYDGNPDEGKVEVDFERLLKEITILGR